jgi:NADPH:quinone reductase-like Zn-dependent oxidoreductase
MKALRLHEASGVQNARLEDVPTPVPAAGEVRVRLVAAALNHRELWIARGMYPGMALPTTMGADGAGVIEAVGDGVDAALLGRETVLYPALNWGADRRFPTSRFGLLGMPGPGTLADYICVPAENAVEKPPALSFEAAAALPVAGVTAFRALSFVAKLQPGETVLVTGIGGGVASLALLFARAMGARVFVTSGSEASIAQAVALGAAGGVNYKDEGWRKTIGKLTGGIDVVIDGAPASSLANYIRALNPGARVVLYGSTGGAAVQINAPELFLKYLTILGTSMGDPDDFRAMIAFAAAHGIRAPVDRVFALSEAAEALQYLETAHGFGKVIVRIAP